MMEIKVSRKRDAIPNNNKNKKKTNAIRFSTPFFFLHYYVVELKTVEM